MNSGIQLEKAREVDIETFAQMEGHSDTAQFIVLTSVQQHRALFLDDSIIYLRIMNSQRIVGFFILVLDKDAVSVEFRRIVIAQNERGIGQNAIRLMESFCRTGLSRSRIWLDVYETNTRGRHIYEKLGYQLFARKTSDSSSLLYYEKSLS